MSKYIVDIDDFEPHFKVDSIGVFGIGKSLSYSEEDHSWSRIKSIEEFEELNSDYINEHFGDLQDTAYQKGFEDGKAVHDKGCEGCMYQDDTIEHHPCGVCRNAYNNMWKAKDDKIEVGDEVKPFYTDITGVVTLIDGDTIYVLWRDGSSTSTLKLKEVTKTGRHFDIKNILEAMKA